MKFGNTVVMVLFLFIWGIACCTRAAAQDIAGDENEVVVAQPVEEDGRDKPFDLGQIIVTGTKSERMLEDVSFYSSVVNMDETTLSGNQGLQDVMDRLAGVYIKKSFPGDTTAKLGLRGLGDNQGHTLILLDGVRLNDGYSGGMILDNVPLDDVDRIEVIRGPNSAIYGANAMGGVINIITKKPGKQKISLDTDFGTYNTNNYNLSYSEKFHSGMGLRLGYNRLETDGYVSQFKYRTISVDTSNPADTAGAVYNPIGNYERALIGEVGARHNEDDNIRLDLSYEFKPGTEMGMRYNYSDSEYEYETGHSWLTDLNGNPSASGTVYVSFPGDTNVYKITSADKTGNWIKGPGGEARDDYSFYYNTRTGSNTDLRFSLDTRTIKRWYNSGIPSSATPTSGSATHNYREEDNLDFRAEGNYYLDAHILTGGLEWRQNELDNGSWKVAFWKDENRSGQRTRLQAGKVRFRSIFLQDEITSGGSWIITPGLRYDNWKVYDGESLTASGTSLVPADPANYPMPSRTKSRVSPKIGLLFKPGGDVNWRFNFGQAFNPPGTYDLFGTWTTSSGTVYRSNPALKPEVNTAWDLGFDFIPGNRKFSMRATYFRNSLQDMISNITISTGPTVKQKENFGKVVIRGIELETDYKFNNRLTANFNMTSQMSKVKSAPDPAIVGLEMEQNPNLMYNLGFDYGLPLRGGDSFSLGINWNHRDKVHTYEDNSDNHSHVYGEYDEYDLVDVSFVYKLHSDKEFFINVDNLFDEDYYEYYLAPGRTFTAGMKLEF